MLPSAVVRSSSAPGLLRWVCTSNPFYVLSAGLFLFGLWVSFGAQASDVDAWALMSGLGGYTLLLAVTACLLVRFGNVWDDVRTVLLLVVLLFLATSVTFDEALVFNRGRGVACSLGGLFFAVLVSEGLLRGTRLVLPLCYRLPYYLILGLFFLYPVALSSLAARGNSTTLLWGLFGFSSAAGLAFLTLLPAVRLGAGPVRDNGSPWGWPLYPWALFGILALAVPARAFLLCWSMHVLEFEDRDRLIFGLYFLIPFGLALGLLLLEGGLVSGRRSVLAAALCVPVGLIALALTGHQPDPVYQGFLETVSARFGGDPLFLTVLLSAAFYTYAALRGVSFGVEALTATLAALAFVGPDTLKEGVFSSPRPEPILAAALLQTALGLWRHSSGRCLVGFAGHLVVATLVLPQADFPAPLLKPALFHLALLALLILGAVFDDVLGKVLRYLAGGLLLAGALAALYLDLGMARGLPAWVIPAYPPLAALLLAGYGSALAHRPSLAAAGVILSNWLAVVGWKGYAGLREVVVGLDHILLGLAAFALAVVVSLAKAGHLSRRRLTRRRA